MEAAARFLEGAVTAGLNIIVAGGTQAGKTTLLNTLINSIPARERVITCEEVFELRPNLPDVVAMQTRQPNLEGHGEIRLRRVGGRVPRDSGLGKTRVRRSGAGGSSFSARARDLWRVGQGSNAAVLKRIARARPFLRTDRLTTVTPTRSDSSVSVI